MTPRVYIVDDDEAIRDSLAWLLQSRGIESVAYASASAFLDACDATFAGCIVLDVRMEEMGGCELFERLLERACPLPVIFLTGHGDVPMAVSMLKNGAFDFVEKPCNNNELVDRVIAALQRDAARRQSAASTESLNLLLNELSTRERQVMERILAGKPNKVIAVELHLSMRTVEVHRSSLFTKMKVRTAVELAQTLAALSGKPVI